MISNVMQAKNLITLYLFGIAAGAIIFPLLFLLGVFQSIDILFYRGIVLLMLSLLLQFLLVFFVFKKINNLSYANIIAILSLTFGLNFGFFTLVPVALDRSISVFLLGSLAGSERALTKEDLSSLFDEFYMKRYSAIDRRVHEQLVSGNIEPSDGGYTLTNRGRKFIATSQLIAHVYGIDDRFLNPKKRLK